MNLPVSKDKYDAAVKERDEAKAQQETVSGGMTELQSRLDLTEKAVVEKTTEIDALKAGALEKETEIASLKEENTALKAEVEKLGAAPGAASAKVISEKETGKAEEGIDVAPYADANTSMEDKVQMLRKEFAK